MCPIVVVNIILESKGTYSLRVCKYERVAVRFCASVVACRYTWVRGYTLVYGRSC